MATGFELPDEGGSDTPLDEHPVVDRPVFGEVRRGYDPREVDAFLAEVAATIQKLEAHPRDPRGQTSSDTSPETPPPTPEDADTRLAERFAKLLALQEHEVTALVDEALREADATRATAEREAEQIRTEAQDEGKRSVEEARAFHDLSRDGADRIRSEALTRRQEINRDLPRIRQSLVGFLDDLETALDSMNEPGDEQPAAGGH